MHPKHVTIVICLSMLMVLCAIASVAGMLASMTGTGVGAMVVLAVLSVILGTYLPAPHARSLTEVFEKLESLKQAVAGLEERQDTGTYDPSSIGQQYNNIAARLAKIEQLYRSPTAEMMDALKEHQEIVKRVALILLQRIDGQSAQQPSLPASPASSPASPQTSTSE